MENWFPAMGKRQNRLPWRGTFFERRLPLRRAEVNGDKSGFHGVEVFGKVGSMPWKNRTIRVPWRGKSANSTSMAWNFLRCNENDDFPGGGRGVPNQARGARRVRRAAMGWSKGMSAA